MRDEEEKMAIEYGAFIVDGLNVKKQTLSLAGQSIGFTDGEGFTGVQNGSEPLVFALARVGPAGWALITGWMTRLWPGLLGVTQVVQPETILRWHRAGFKTFWRWLPDSEHHEPRNAGSHGPHHRGADRRLRHSVLGAATMPPTRSSLIGRLPSAAASAVAA
jgi:hypothetical protein